MAWEPPSASEAARARRGGAAGGAGGRARTRRCAIALVEALGKVGGRAGGDAIAALLDGEERVRAAVAAGDAGQEPGRTLDGRRARELRGAAAATGMREVRWAAALALLRLRDPASRAALRGCTRDAAVHVRATCAKALADVGDEHDADVLAPLADDADDAWRRRRRGR